ncbi:MAG: hypothetical protein Fur0010_26940 [Bdellovibrio sp.]
MTYLLFPTLNRKYLRIKYLPLTTLTVKSILLLMLGTHFAYGQTPENTRDSTLFLAIGEHAEISVAHRQSYTNGNREVVATKMMKGNKTLLIKALKQGFSEIALFENGKKMSATKVFVTNKLEKLNVISIAEELQDMNLKTINHVNNLYVAGEIDQLHQFIRLHQLKNELKESLLIDIEMTKNLKKEILSGIYKISLGQKNYEFFCEIKKIQVSCFYDDTKPLSEDAIKKITSDYFVQMIAKNAKSKNSNFKVKLKIIQMESTSGREINWGLSEINGTLDELFTAGLRGVISKNSLILAQSDISLSTLAEPVLLMQAGEESVIEIGTDIPYQGKRQVDWKFAGLRIKLKLNRIGREIILSYTTEFGQPHEGGQISSNRQNSKIKIDNDSPLEIYQIGFETQSKHQDQIPGFGDIPLLGELFKGRGQGRTYKKLSAVILIEELYANL